MDNAAKIDAILEDLRSRIEPPKPKSDETLSSAQMELKNFLKERRINYLVHFTDERNINSIKENGILSIKQLNKRQASYVSNDENRNDNKHDYISLSVSGINQPVYKTFRYVKQTLEHGVAVVIDADMLYKEIGTHRIYCSTNAATTVSHKGDSFDSLKAMFGEVVEYSTSAGGKKEVSRRDKNRFASEPTDTQAEILWSKRVPQEYILFYWDLEVDFF